MVGSFGADDRAGRLDAPLAHAAGPFRAVTINWTHRPGDEAESDSFTSALVVPIVEAGIETGTLAAYAPRCRCFRCGSRPRSRSPRRGRRAGDRERPSIRRGAAHDDGRPHGRSESEGLRHRARARSRARPGDRPTAVTAHPESRGRGGRARRHARPAAGPSAPRARVASRAADEDIRRRLHAARRRVRHRASGDRRRRSATLLHAASRRGVTDDVPGRPPAGIRRRSRRMAAGRDERDVRRAGNCSHSHEPRGRHRARRGEASGSNRRP